MLRPRRKIVVLGLTAVTIVAATALRLIATGSGTLRSRVADGVQLERLRQRGIESRCRWTVRSAEVGTNVDPGTLSTKLLLAG